MTILPKAIYRFNAMASKILHGPQKNNSQPPIEKQKKKKTRIAKTILYNKGTSESITFPDFKLYSKATSTENTLVLV